MTEECPSSARYLSQGYQLPGTSYKGFVSSYKVQYSYDRHRWITYIEGTENSTHRGYRVSCFISNNKAFIRLDSYCQCKVQTCFISIYPTY